LYDWSFPWSYKRESPVPFEGATRQADHNPSNWKNTLSTSTHRDLGA
jgi:hypothetical protein